MDNSRDQDLLRLYKRFTNPNVHKKERRRIHNKFVNIQNQLTDRGLTKLRYALINASRNGTAEDINRLELQIKEYSRLKARDRSAIA